MVIASLFGASVCPLCHAGAYEGRHPDALFTPFLKLSVFGLSALSPFVFSSRLVALGFYPRAFNC